MKDIDCVQFLQWAAPLMHMRWAGFRRVRAQVCKRLNRRIRQLGISSASEYRDYLQVHPDEWIILDALSRVTISRFYRDRFVFRFLEQEVLPYLAQQAIARGDNNLKIWSAGCGSGEEPYTFAIIWRRRLRSIYPGLRLHIVATDADPRMCERARQASYQYSSIKNLPEEMRERAFTRQGDLYCLRSEYQKNIHFMVQDVRRELPDNQFDMVCCRNLVFTYYDEALQCSVIERMRHVFKSGGALVLGIHEHLPECTTGFNIWSEKLRVYKKK